MASLSSLQLANPFSSSCSITPKKKKNFTTRASSSDSDSDSETPPPPPPPEGGDDFDNRLAQVRLRYRSGTGKKAEVRKGKKPFKKGAGAGVFLPPIPLKEPVSGGVKVELGFTPYTERMNGRLAGLGLAALLLVELGSGKSVLRYHSPPIVFLQLYFVTAVSAIFIKFEKEKVSFWPQSSTTTPDNQST